VPEVVVFAMAGRSLKEKQSLLKDITDAVVRNFRVAADLVTVQIVECAPELKSKGGIPYSERPPGAIKN